MRTSLNKKGFTIVELLIVVVVIAILASITIVSYNGITKRANASAARSAAVTVQKKAELYTSDGPTGRYPASFDLLIDQTQQSKSYFIGEGIGNTAPYQPTADEGTNNIRYSVCGNAGTGVSNTLASTTNITGATIEFYNYNSSAVETIFVGQYTGLANGFNVACFDD